MKEYKIKSLNTKSILFQGRYPSMQACIEDAIATGTDLNHADLRRLDLSNITLDNAKLTHVNFTDSNLTGANLSETNLQHCIFQSADLYNVCLAYANIENCSFDGASFGATDIYQTVIKNCIFSNLTCFTLNFKNAKKFTRCRFVDLSGIEVPMRNAPVVVIGLADVPLIFMNDQVWRGHDPMPGRNWMAPITPRTAGKRP